MNDKLGKHRVIGVRHALKAFKDEGLIDDDTFYPKEAVDEISDKILLVARRWYIVGAKRGALEVLEAIINGDITVRETGSNNHQLTAHVENINWTKALNVSVGAEKKKIGKKSYNLSVKDLGFE